MLERMKERWKYTRRLLLPLALYLTLLALAMHLVVGGRLQSPWNSVAVLAPMLPAIWIVAGMLGAIRRLDELDRKILLEAIAISFALTLLACLALGLLHLAGMPAFNPVYIAFFMALAWLVAKLLIHKRYQ